MTESIAPAEGHRAERLPTLDFLRFVAAAMVVLFHYTFRGAVDGAYTSTPFPEVDAWTRYGSLGVDLFFMISGFVILLTVDAGRGNPAHFVASRISRLFPAFWAAATVTFLVCLFAAPPFAVSARDYLLNLGMFPSWLGAPYVDGVYSTLETELTFYLLVLGYLLFLWQRLRLEWLLLGWLLLVAAFVPNELGPSRVRALLMVDAAPFFIGGCTFYRIWRDRWTPFRAILVGGAWLAAAVVAGRDAVAISASYGTEVSSVVSSAIVSLGFGVFLALCLRPSWFHLGGRRATLLGALTYPLYLIHQKIGYLVINATDPVVGRWLAFGLAIAVAVGLAVTIHLLIERRFNSRFRRWLEPRLALLSRVAGATRTWAVRRQRPREAD